MSIITSRCPHCQKNNRVPSEMTIIDGELEVKLPGTQSWHTFTNGDQFEVEANSSFDVKVILQTAYHCTYQ